MDERRRFIAETTELGKIDYFLDHLARAVERGEVHRGSYDMLAPRYLERRGELVAIITGEHRSTAAAVSGSTGVAEASAPAGVASTGAVGTSAPTHAAGPVPAFATAGTVSGAHPRSHAAIGSATAARPVPKPVAWTTVLLFLGAFLVVVASAIFAVAVWDLLGATGKLAFLGTLTVAFYGAGWWARNRLETPAGSTALIAVASALLLFDGWIAIDGYGLEGPMPWAVLLLTCSAVYWFTEVRLAGRFFGVFGAAAQLGWWWLLGEGIGLPVPLRLAGMSLVALAWQFAAERGERSPAVRSLARVLAVAAPVTQVVLCAGILADLLFVGSAGPTEVATAGVVSLAAAWTVFRSGLVSSLRCVPEAVLQLPLVIATGIAVDSTGHSWSIAGILLLAALAYSTFAIARAGAPFAVLGLGAELATLLEVGTLARWSDTTTLSAVAILAATWAVASRLARGLEADTAAEDRATDETDTPWYATLPGLPAVRSVAESGSLVTLAVASILLYAHTAQLPADRLVPADIVATVAVLAAWLTAAYVARLGAFLVPAVVWTLVPVGMAGRLIAGNDHPAVRYGAMLLTQAVWLFVSRPAARPFADGWRDAVRWVARAGMLATPLIGIGWELVRVRQGGATDVWGSWPAVLLAVGAAALFAVDSAVFRCPPSAAAAGGLATLGGALAGGTVPMRYPDQFAVAGAGTSLLLGTAGAVLRRFVRRYGGFVAVAAAGIGTAAAMGALPDAGSLALALALSSAAWVAATLAAGRPFAFLAGLGTLATMLVGAAWIEAPPTVTVVAVGGMALAFVSTSFVRRPVAEEPVPVLQAALTLAGLAGLAVLVLLGLVAEVFGGSGEWWDVGGFDLALTFSFLGTALLIVSWRYTMRPLAYAGWGVLLLALWTAFGAGDLETAELFTTSLAAYLLGMGYLAKRFSPDRPHPVLLDAAAVLVGLGVPLWLSLVTYPPGEAALHAAWAVGLSLLAIGAGIALKVRWYFFGGVSALAGIALYRSFSALVEVWWLVLFVIGVGLLVVALTWERQRVVVSSTRERLKRSFEQWR